MSSVSESIPWFIVIMPLVFICIYALHELIDWFTGRGKEPLLPGSLWYWDMNTGMHRLVSPKPRQETCPKCGAPFEPVCSYCGRLGSRGGR